MPHTLLLADDSVTIQRVIELTFADEDIRVIAVGDGQQAIDRITADPPDIVLADTGMPERDGYDVATFIKNDPALAHIPVVLLTGAFEPVDGDRARQVGCDAVLVKPFEPQVVINRVRELLEKRSGPAVPAVSSPFDDGLAQDDATDAPTQQAETAGHLVHDWGETVDLAAQHASAGETEGAPPTATNEPATGSNDPLEDYLERMDEAFDRLETEEPAVSGQARTAREEPRPAVHATSATETDLDPLEGALSELEGALDKFGFDGLDAKTDDDVPDAGGVALSTADESSPPLDWLTEAPVAVAPPVDGPPSTPASDVAPTPEPVARMTSPSQPSSEIVIEPTSLTETRRSVEVEGPSSPTPERVSAAASVSEPLAPAPPVPEPVVAPAGEPLAPLLQPLPEAADPPVRVDPAADTPVLAAPPSLADAFASLLAAEQGDAARARTVYPWPRPTSSPGMNEELVERVAERVIARLSDGVGPELVAQVVARVAEKLVREEIDRIKQA